jgi:hypothetical protein
MCKTQGLTIACCNNPNVVIRQAERFEMCKTQSLTAACCSKLYTNLASLYNLHQYPFDHIWNNNETCVQACKQAGPWVLARRRSNAVYSTIPKSQEWLIINCVVNVTNGSLLSFYFFKGEWLINNYINLCKPGTCMVMQKKAWMIFFCLRNFYLSSSSLFHVECL